jgi:hypothetical protein
MISETDILFLRSLGDTNMGYVARGENAEMYGVDVEDIDDFILT